MAQVSANGIRIEYESYGSSDAPVVLLVMGLASQLTRWPLAFVQKLAAHGYRVIRFDNRDIGLSTKFDAAGLPNLSEIVAAMQAGKIPGVPYTLHDMAADVVGLLDALKIQRAHIVGASMGGMIAQLVAADYPERVLSLTSIMSNTGNPALPPATPEAQAILYTPAPLPSDTQAYGDHAVRASRAIGSPGYPTDEKLIRERALADGARSYSPTGAMRQIAAITATGDRRMKLRTIKAPTLVIHGADDALVRVQGGEDTAATIAGSKLLIIPGMGHDLPAALYNTIIDAILGVIKRATGK
jgi:pimeloyl-ACP methyl ester carboxylesterase